MLSPLQEQQHQQQLQDKLSQQQEQSRHEMSKQRDDAQAAAAHLQQELKTCQVGRFQPFTRHVHGWQA